MFRSISSTTRYLHVRCYENSNEDTVSYTHCPWYYILIPEPNPWNKHFSSCYLQDYRAPCHGEGVSQKLCGPSSIGASPLPDTLPYNPLSTSFLDRPFCQAFPSCLLRNWGSMSQVSDIFLLAPACSGPSLLSHKNPTCPCVSPYLPTYLSLCLIQISQNESLHLMSSLLYLCFLLWPCLPKVPVQSVSSVPTIPNTPPLHCNPT